MTGAVESAEEQPDEMRAEYDFSNAVRGKHAGGLDRDTVLVTLEPDLAAAFPTSASVNDALRLLLSIKRQVGAA